MHKREPEVHKMGDGIGPLTKGHQKFPSIPRTTKTNTTQIARYV